MTLELSLGSSKMSKMTTAKLILISITNIGAELKSSFGFYINTLLHKFFKAIKFLAMLFYFGSYKSF